MNGHSTYATGTYSSPGPLGDYAVTLTVRDGGPTTAPGSPGALDVVDLDDLTYDTPGARPFGVGLFGAALTVTVADDGTLAAVLSAAVRDDDVALRVSGPDGHGGTLTWEGIPDLVELAETLSPQIYPAGDLPITFRCGIGAAEDADPQPEEVDGGEPLPVVTGLQTVAPQPMFVRLTGDPIVSGSAEADPSGLQYGYAVEWDGETLDYEALPGFLDLGGLADQLGGLAFAHTLGVYLSLRQVTPEWHVVPRALLGQTLSDGYTISADGETGTAGVERTGRTVTFNASWTAEEERSLVRRLPPRHLDVQLPEGALLNRDPGFSNGLTYWSASGSPSANTDGDGVSYVHMVYGDEIAQDLGRVAPGTYPGCLFLFVYDDPSPMRLDVRFVLDGDDGSTYWLGASGWDTVDDEATVATVKDADGTTVLAGDGDPPYASGEPFRYVAGTSPTPVAGALSIELKGDGRFYRVEAYRSDSGGLAVVDTLRVTFSTLRAAGEPVEIPAPPFASHTAGAVEGYAAPASAPASSYPILPTALAAHRAVQTSGPDGAPLLVFREVEVPGLIGPDTLARFTGGGALASAVDAVFCGGSLSFREGVTRATWCELRDDGLTTSS